jgi:hypothetical protein
MDGMVYMYTESELIAGWGRIFGSESSRLSLVSLDFVLLLSIRGSIPELTWWLEVNRLLRWGLKKGNSMLLLWGWSCDSLSLMV